MTSSNIHRSAQPHISAVHSGGFEIAHEYLPDLRKPIEKLNCCVRYVLCYGFVVAPGGGDVPSETKETTMTRQTGRSAAAAAAVIAAGTLVGPLATGTAHAAPHPTAGPRGGNAVALALVDAEVVAEITGKDMAVAGTEQRLHRTSNQVSPGRCLSVHAPVQEATYEGVEWTSATVQTLADGEPGSETGFVVQAAVKTASAQDIKAYLNDTLDAFEACAGTTLQITTRRGDRYQEEVGRPWMHDDNTVLTIATETSSGVACERAVAGARGYLVLDVMVCHKDDDPRGQALDVAREMMRNTGTDPRRTA